jgi:hypothetical protein
LGVLVRRLLLLLILVLVFTGVAWDESGGGNKHLEIDLAVGVGATAVVSGAWWLAKRGVATIKGAFRQGYQETVALQSHQVRGLARRLAHAQRRTSRPEYGQALIREAAGRAGRFVGSTKRAFWEGYGPKGDKDR